MKTEVASATFNPENIADLYVRVSTSEQAEEGYSVGEQEARLRSYCSAMGFTVNAVHIDPGYSGATLDRPGINKVIKDVQAGYVKRLSSGSSTASPALKKTCLSCLKMSF